MRLDSYPTNRNTFRANNRSAGQKLQMLGVYGWIGIILFIGYLAACYVFSRIEKVYNAQLNPILDEPIEIGGRVMAPGDYMIVHAEGLAILTLAVALAFGLRWIARTFKI